MVNKLSHKAECNPYMADQCQLRVLIADDDFDILSSFEDIIKLEIDDCYVDKASNADQARVRAQQVKPDVAFIDIKLGLDNGLELIPELKCINPDIAIVMMTAYRNIDYTISAIRHGADDYLLKPIEPTKLIQTIKQLFQQLCLKRKVIQAERRFGTVFEQASQWLFLIDTEGQLIEVNETALEFIGKNKESVAGEALFNTPWWKLSPSAIKSIQEGIKYAKRGELYHDEVSVRENEQTLQTYDLYMKSVYFGDNMVDQIIVECRNITDRINAEKEILQLNNTLENRVHERTMELTHSLSLLKKEIEQRKQIEELLNRAKKKAEKASRAKSEFMSRMSHELITPMNAILGFSQLLKYDDETPLTVSQLEAIDNIIESGYHLLDFIHDVLEISRIESGKYKLEKEKININTVIQACLSTLNPLISKQNISIQNETATLPESYIIADFKYLKQSLFNIISNAIKYNRKNGEVNIYCQQIKSGRLRIIVSDTGIGISADNQKLLFQPFERLGREYEVKGTGIGLIVAKRLIEAMGGSIGYDSASKHTTFWIELESS